MKLRPSISALSQVDDEKAKIEAEAEKLNEMMGEIEDEDEATACSERVQCVLPARSSLSRARLSLGGEADGAGPRSRSRSPRLP